MGKYQKVTFLKQQFKKYWKIVLAIIIVSAALLFFPVQKAFRNYTSQLLQDKVTKLVDEKTAGQYSFEFDDLRYNVFKQQIKLANFRFFLKDKSQLKFDSKESENQVYYLIEIQNLEIRLKDQFDFFFNDKLEINVVVVSQPNITVINNRIQKNNVSLTKISGDLYRGITEYLQVFELKNLVVKEAKLDYQLHTKSFKKEYKFNSFSFKLHNFKLNRQKGKTKNGHLLFTDEFEINSGYQEFVMPDGLHKVSYDRFGVSMEKEFVEIYNLRITPLHAKGDNESDRVEVFVPTVKLINVDFEKAYYENEINIRKLLIERPKLNLQLTVNNLDIDSLSISERFAKSNILDIINTLVVEQLILSHSSVLLELTQNDRQRDFLVKGLNYQGSKLKIDSSTFANFVFGNLQSHYKFNVKEIKHEIIDEGLLAKVENLNYSSLTKALDIDEFLIIPNADKIQKNLHKHNKKIQLQKLKTNGVHLSNFNINEISDERILNLTSSRVSGSEITFLYDTAYVEDTMGVNGTDSYLLGSFLDTFITTNFKLENALIKIQNADNPAVEFGRFEKVNFYVNKINLYSLTNNSFDVYDLLESSGITTSTSFVNIPGLEKNISWRAMDYSSARNKIKFHQLKYKGIDQNSKINAHFKSVSVYNFSLKELVKNKEYNLVLVEANKGKIDFIELGKSNNSTKVKSNVHIDSVALNDIDFIHTRKDTIKQRIEKLFIHAGDINFTTDTLGNKNLGLVNLDFKGEKGQFSIDNNKHYIDFKNLTFSSFDSTFNVVDINITPVIDQRNKSSKTLIRSHAEYISLSGVALNSNNIQSEIVGEKLDICSPEFRMSTILTEDKKPKVKRSFLEVHKWLVDLTGINLIKYGAFNIENGLVDIVFESESNRPKIWHLSIPQYNILAREFRLDSAQVNTDEHFFYAKSYELDAYNLEQTFPDSLQNVKIDHLTYKTENQYLKLEKANLKYMIYRTNDGSRQMYVDGTIPLVEMEGLKPFELKDNKILNLSRLHLKNPEIEITQFHKNTDFVSRELNVDKSNKDKTAIKKLVLNELELFDGNITWVFEGEETSGFKFNHFGIKGTEVKINSEKKNELPKFGEIEMSFGDFRHDVMQKYYDLQIDSFYMNSNTERMSLLGAQLTPRYGIFEFAKVANWEKSRLELYLSKIDFEQFSVKEFLYNNTLKVGLVKVDSLGVRNFKNKNYRMISRFMPVPTLNLTSSKIKINVDSLRLNKGYIEHRQLARNGVKSGRLLFTELESSVSNITNDSLAISKNGFLTMNASTKLMGEGLINAKFDFDLKDAAQRFVGYAHVGKFDATVLNSYLEPTAYIRIRKGNISNGDLQFFGDDEFGAGEMELIYKNLHVDFLNQKDTFDNNNMGLLMKSFFANRLVNTNNPHFFIKKRGGVYYVRDTGRSIFHYLGNIAMSGVASSTGISNNKKEVKKLRKEIKQLNKQALRKEKAIRRKEEEDAEGEAKDKKKEA